MWVPGDYQASVLDRTLPYLIERLVHSDQPPVAHSPDWPGSRRSTPDQLDVLGLPSPTWLVLADPEASVNL